MKGVESRLDGSMLVVRIPMPLQRRGGRRRIVAPDGSELAPSSKPQPKFQATTQWHAGQGARAGVAMAEAA
jgi:hypothetical protein